MAVLIGTRTGFELVDEVDVDDVAFGRGLRPGPRVLRRLEIGDSRRPASRPLSVHRAPEAVACRVRPSGQSPVQLLAIGVLVALAVVALGLLYLQGSGAATVPERTGVVYVQVGETLWDVAERSAPESDTAAVVERIRDLNQMDDSAVLPGQPLTVPDGRADTAP